VAALAVTESSLKYHPGNLGILTSYRYPVQGQCLVGSLTGAVASQRVTEAREGYLKPDRNRLSSARAEGSLTERPTGRTDTKVGPSDPVVPHGRAIAQRIKGTPGITG
jgi:Family of unknown function (DUF6467)